MVFGEKRRKVRGLFSPQTATIEPSTKNSKHREPRTENREPGTLPTQRQTPNALPPN
jgi:hypothetical protein